MTPDLPTKPSSLNGIIRLYVKEQQVGETPHSPTIIIGRERSFPPAEFPMRI